MPSLQLQKIPEYYHRYVNLINEDDLFKALQSSHSELNNILENLPEEKWNYAYAEGKWTIKELVQHIIDAERIFCHRALTIARNDENPLPGFDENAYAEESKANNRSSTDLFEELKAVQTSTRCLFSSFDNDQLEREGIANGKSISVIAIVYILAGHTRHHNNILKERYL